MAFQTTMRNPWKVFSDSALSFSRTGLSLASFNPLNVGLFPALSLFDDSCGLRVTAQTFTSRDRERCLADLELMVGSFQRMKDEYQLRVVSNLYECMIRKSSKSSKYSMLG